MGGLRWDDGRFVAQGLRARAAEVCPWDRATMTSEDQASEDKDRDGSEARIQAVIHLAEQIAADDVRDGYTHIGAATSGAFRFKWTVRQQADGRYFVEETIGSSGVAVRSLPMLKADVLPYIEQRQRGIQAKVDAVKRELASIQGLPEEIPQETERDPQQMYDEIRRMLKEGK
jgi:hypothetical protein